MTLQSIIDQFDLLMDTPESVPKLRQFILQLAVEGNLTDRHPSDGSAEDLLERIQAEKERLYDEGEIRKSQAKLPEVAEGPRSLPDGWIWIELERTGVVNPRHDADEDVPASFVPMKLIEDETGGGHDAEVRPWGEIRRGYTHFKEGDVGLAKITPCFQNRKSTVFRNLENGIGAGTTELYVFRPLGNTILPEFVLSFFQSAGFIEEGVNRMTGTAGQQRVPRDYVEQSLLPLPPLAEQQRIVATVDRLMAACDTLDAQQDAAAQVRVRATEAATHALQTADTPAAVRTAWHRLRAHFDVLTATPEDVDALRQTILQLAVQGKLTEQDPRDEPASKMVERSKEEVMQLYSDGKITRPSKRPKVEKEEKVFQIPDSWTWTRLGNVLALVNGRAYKKEELLDEGTPVMRIQNLGGGGSWYYSNLDLPPEKYCRPGDLLYAWSGTFGPYIWDGPKAIFHYHIWRIELTRAITKKYAYHLLKAVSAAVEKDAHGIMLPHMTKGGMEKLVIPVPPLEEQHRIVTTVDQLMDTCDKLELQLSQQEDLGVGLLEAVLHGAVASGVTIVDQDFVTA
jgi:type I restriction enzyme S subunit